MNIIGRTAVVMFVLLAALTVPAQPAQAGAEHFEWPFAVLDYSDCTAEEVFWQAIVRQTLLINETPSGQVLILDNWGFEGTVEGLSSGYIWSTKGRANYHETFSLNNSLTGGFALLENAILKPITPGAPRVKLDVLIRFAFNAHGDPVVERVIYTYNCVGE